MKLGLVTIAAMMGHVFLAGAGSATAQTTVVIPAANANAEGTASTQLPLGNGGATNVTSQFLFGTSQLSNLPVGSLINAIGFRVNSNSLAPTTALDFSNYAISLGSSTRAVGSLTTNFAANQAADTTLVRSGALTIPVGSFTATPSGTGLDANPFFSIDFTTPFAYTGGDLLLTLSYTTTGTRGLVLDGVPLSVGGLDSVSNINPLGTYTQLYNVPVVQFTTTDIGSTVPEPATWAMMVLGVGATGIAARRRRHRIEQAAAARSDPSHDRARRGA